MKTSMFPLMGKKGKYVFTRAENIFTGTSMCLN